MKRIRTIRHWSAILLVLSGFMISVFLFSCSQEEEVPSNLYEYTPQQKEEIMALAEKYGLNIKFQEEKPEKPLPTVQEVEHFFQNLVTMMSKPHTLCLVKEGEVATQIPQLRTRAESTSETGSWQGTASIDQSWINLKISWTKPSPTSQEKVNFEFHSPYRIEEMGYYWSSNNEILYFEFAGDMAGTNLWFIGQGSIQTISGYGSFTVIELEKKS